MTKNQKINNLKERRAELITEKNKLIRQKNNRNVELAESAKRLFNYNQLLKINTTKLIAICILVITIIILLIKLS